MYDERTNLTRTVADDLRDFFQDDVLKTVIPQERSACGSSQPWETDPDVRSPLAGGGKLY